VKYSGYIGVEGEDTWSNKKHNKIEL